MEDIEKILKLLTSPATALDVTSACQDAILESCFRATVDAVKNYLDENNAVAWLKEALGDYQFQGPSNDTYWDFTTFCMKVLLCLNKHITIQQECQKEREAEQLPDVLSVQQQKDIHGLLQFITCLGISRNLLPGVGIPLQLRSKFGGVLLENASRNISAFNKYEMLFSTTSALITCANNPLLGTLIMTRHLGDILAALFQLSYAPTKEADMKEPDSDVSSSAEMEEKRCRSRQHLDDLVDKTYQPLVIRELLILLGPQSSPSKVEAIAKYKSPQWLRRSTQVVISKRLTKKNGVKALIEAILAKTELEELSSQSFLKKCDIIAKLLATPSAQPSADSYFESICAQVLNLFRLNESRRNHPLIKVASITVKTMVLRQPTLANTYIIRPLTTPLLACCCNQEVDVAKPTEEAMTFCITTLHKIFVVDSDPSDQSSEVLSPLFGILMSIFSFINNGVSYLRSVLEDLLCHYLKHAEPLSALKSIKAWVLPDDTVPEMLRWNAQLVVKYGAGGGITVVDVAQLEGNSHEWLDSDESQVGAIIHLLSKLHDEKVVVDFFLDILQELSKVFQCSDEAPLSSDEIGNSSHDLLRLERTKIQEEFHLRKSLKIFQILSALCQYPTLLESLLKDKEKMVQFIMITLERGAQLCEKPELTAMESETVTIGLTILTMLVATKDLGLLKLLKCCLPPLKVLADAHSVTEIKISAAELHNLIITHGVANLQDRINNDFITSTTDSHTVPPKSKYHQAWNDFLNPDPPIKGHAILALSKLIKSNDVETLENKDKLLTAFQELLNHEDSYVYLMAIRGLATLADNFPDVVIPCLVAHYGQKEKRTPEMRLKVGEVLSKTINTLGDVVPKYRDLLLAAFLSTSKDSHPLIRASSVSCLGELCKGLRYSLGPFVNQVVNALMHFITYDPSLEVRLAAVHSIVAMLRGMGKDALKILEGTIKDMYRQLKKIYQDDKNDKMKLQAQLALEELDIICRDFIFPKQTLEKKISLWHF